MKPGALEVNDLIMVRPLVDTRGRAYPSRVEDLEREMVTLAWPTDGGMRITLHLEESLYLSYTGTDAVYGIQGTIKQIIHEPVPLVRVRLFGRVERIQRREYVRVQANLPVELTLSSPVGDGPVPAIAHFFARTLELSAGGMAIQHKESIPLGSLFDIRLTLPGNSSPLEFSAKVVRSSIFRDAFNEKMHRYGMMFLHVPEGHRSRLVKFVFDVQLKYRNR